jgi:hypothetical protein
MASKEKLNELVRNAITRLAQIERCEGSIDTPYPCQTLIRFIITETEEPLRDAIALQQFRELTGDCLLCELHAGRLDSDDSRRF